MTIQIRSAHDPLIKFSHMTNGSFSLDQSTRSQVSAGIILLLFALAMLSMSAYKTYRYCIKYTMRDYFSAKRRKAYLAKSIIESEASAL